jgi:hypothetical protein
MDSSEAETCIAHLEHEDAGRMDREYPLTRKNFGSIVSMHKPIIESSLLVSSQKKFGKVRRCLGEHLLRRKSIHRKVIARKSELE